MDTTERLHFHFSLSCIGEGNGNPLQRSCLENTRDRGAWWAAVYGVAQSRTRVKGLSSRSNKIVAIIFIVIFLFITPFGEPEINDDTVKGKWRMGKESGLARVHRASQGGSARLQCPNGTPSAPPPRSPPLGPSGELGPAGPSKAGWVRLLSCGSSSS